VVGLGKAAKAVSVFVWLLIIGLIVWAGWVHEQLMPYVCVSYGAINITKAYNLNATSYKLVNNHLIIELSDGEVWKLNLQTCFKRYSVFSFNSII